MRANLNVQGQPNTLSTQNADRNTNPENVLPELTGCQNVQTASPINTIRPKIATSLRYPSFILYAKDSHSGKLESPAYSHLSSSNIGALLAMRAKLMNPTTTERKLMDGISTSGASLSSIVSNKILDTVLVSGLEKIPGGDCLYDKKYNVIRFYIGVDVVNIWLKHDGSTDKIQVISEDLSGLTLLTELEKDGVLTQGVLARLGLSVTKTSPTLNEGRMLQKYERNLSGLSGIEHEGHDVSCSDYNIAKEALKTARGFYKGSVSKSSNKIYISCPRDKHITKILSVREIRTENRRHEDIVYESAKRGSGNCGEMSCIAYSICKERGLTVSIVVLDDKSSGFNHQFCSVNINDEDYALDPWANLLCKRDEFIDKLIDKKIKWANRGKSVLKSDLKMIQGNPSLSVYRVTEQDIKNMVVQYEGVLLSNPSEPFDTSYLVKKLELIKGDK